MSLGRCITSALVVFLFAIGSAAVGVTSAVGSQPESTGRPILDQYNTDVLSSYLNGGSAAYQWQQGITAGVAGQLTRIALFVVIDPALGEPSATELSIRLGSPWQTGIPAWTTITVPRAGWNTFDVSKAKIFVEPGDEYAIGIHGQSTTHQFNPGFGFSYDEQYPGGDLYLDGSTAESIGNDLLFRTYVSPKRVKRN